MKTSFSLKVLKLALQIKGVKKTWAKSPLDINTLRKDDLTKPPLSVIKRNAGSSFKIMESQITELGNPKSKFITIYFPGGAFLSGPKDYNYAFAEKLANNCPTKVWLVNYPKAPEHKIDQISANADKIFEAALCKTDANKIILIGDSAGGNIIMTLTQRLILQKKELPLCLVPITPVFDASMTNLSIKTWNDKDFILDKNGVLEANQLALGDQMDLKNPMISPLYGDFSGFPPLLLFLAENDVLYPDGALGLKKMIASSVNVQYLQGLELPHIWPVLPFIKEGKIAQKEIFNYLNGIIKKVR